MVLAQILLKMKRREFSIYSTFLNTVYYNNLLIFLSRGGAGVSVAKTLELIKAVLQTSFNQELKKLCDDYLQVNIIF